MVNWADPKTSKEGKDPPEKSIYDLFLESVIVQALLTIGLTGVASYLWIKQLPVPDPLMLLLGAAWGFYFRSKGGAEAAANAARRQAPPPI